MQNVISIIRSKGTVKSKENGNDIPFDNMIFWLTSGDKFYSHEELIAGQGKPTYVKIKTKEFNEVYKEDPKGLIGKEVHFISEFGTLKEIQVQAAK